MIELLTGLLFLACYWYFGLTLSTLKYCVFAFLLLGLIFTDAETKLLPDKLTLPGLALGVIFSLLVPVNDLASQFLIGHGEFAIQRRRFIAASFAARFPARRGCRSIFHLRRGRNLSPLARHRRNGLRRCQADGHGRGVPRNQADHLHDFTASLAGSIFGLLTVSWSG